MRPPRIYLALSVALGASMNLSDSICYGSQQEPIWLHLLLLARARTSFTLSAMGASKNLSGSICCYWRQKKSIWFYMLLLVPAKIYLALSVAIEASKNPAGSTCCYGSQQKSIRLYLLLHRGSVNVRVSSCQQEST